MNATMQTSNNWACDRCGVRISWMTGEQTELPANWSSSEDGQFCLICRRDRAGEAAIESAGPDASHAVRAQLRRSAVLEFEVTRDPERSNAEIARACRATAPAIAEVRKRLGYGEADPAWSTRAKAKSAKRR
jgi:hypothetical protein